MMAPATLPPLASTSHVDDRRKVAAAPGPRYAGRRAVAQSRFIDARLSRPVCAQARRGQHRRRRGLAFMNAHFAIAITLRRH